MKVWCKSPLSGGNKISPEMQKVVEERANLYSSKQAWFPNYKLKLRFKGQFCYLDAHKVGENPFPIGRLRYHCENEWSLAFYTYSNEKYEPCYFNTGQWFGTLEQGISTCEMYLYN